MRRDVRRLDFPCVLGDAPRDALTGERRHRHVMQAGVDVHVVHEVLWRTRHQCPIRLRQFLWGSLFGSVGHRRCPLSFLVLADHHTRGRSLRIHARSTTTRRTCSHRAGSMRPLRLGRSRVPLTGAKSLPRAAGAGMVRPTPTSGRACWVTGCLLREHAVLDRMSKGKGGNPRPSSVMPSRGVRVMPRLLGVSGHPAWSPQPAQGRSVPAMCPRGTSFAHGMRGRRPPPWRGQDADLCGGRRQRSCI